MSGEPDRLLVCAHGLTADCEECLHEQNVRDDQATGDDWMFDPLWEPS